jgi:mRNA interferase RelE/StbE
VKTYSIEFTPAARRNIIKLQKGFQEDILGCIESLATNPRPKGTEKIGEFYRIHYNDFRIIYSVDDKTVVILVLKVGDRKDIYKNQPTQVLKKTMKTTSRRFTLQDGEFHEK